jgi:PAS domain S-box-containing protein
MRTRLGLEGRAKPVYHPDRQPDAAARFAQNPGCPSTPLKYREKMAEMATGLHFFTTSAPQRLTASVTAIVLIFLLDVLAPPSLNISLLYIFPVGINLGLPWRNFVIVAASVCVLLTFGDFFLLEHPSGIWPGLLNPLMTSFAIAGVTLLDVMLAQSKERMNAVLDTAAEGILVIDGGGVIESFNQMAEEIFGYSAAEVIGQNVRILMPSPFREEHDGDQDSGEPRIIGRRHEVSGIRRNGETFPLEIAVAETDLGIRRIFTGVVRDITRRKRNEESILRMNEELQDRAKELTRVNEELSQFAHVVSHDLKAPLRAIANYSAWLAEDLDATQMNDDTREYLEGLQKAVRQSEELIEEILDLSRIGRQKVTSEHLHLTGFFEELAGSLEPGHDCEVSIQNGLPVIAGPPVLLRQIFQNLILNGVKYNRSEHKRISIAGRLLENGALEIAVRDNGIGIDPRFHERIFQIFQRLHTREEYDGTGIGLAIVKKAAQQLDYAVRVESALDRGSTFFVVIPASSILSSKE